MLLMKEKCLIWVDLLLVYNVCLLPVALLLPVLMGIES